MSTASGAHVFSNNIRAYVCNYNISDGHLISFDIASTLSSVSIMRSPYHDGFHFIDIEHWQISHLSQYISPPIPQGADKQLHGTGARLMSAMLASLLHGIVCVGLVSKEGKIYLFHSGIDIAREN
jgi:hypothetical protein